MSSASRSEANPKWCSILQRLVEHGQNVPRAARDVASDGGHTDNSGDHDAQQNEQREFVNHLLVRTLQIQPSFQMRFALDDSPLPELKRAERTRFQADLSFSVPSRARMEEDIDCYFYTIKRDRRDAGLVEQWLEARRVAQGIRESYDRETERKFVASFGRTSRDRPADGDRRPSLSFLPPL